MSKDSNVQPAAEQSGAPKVFRRGCIIIPNALHHMVHDAGLKDADWGTLVALLGLCRYGTRQYYACNARIGEACGLSKSAVGRSLSRLAKSGLIERRYDQGDHCWGTRLLFDPRSLVAKEGQRDWTLAVAEQLAVDEADETKSHRLDVFEGKKSSRVAATTIPERCEELAIGSYWFSDTAIRTIFLYRGCDGRFFERAIDIDGTTLEIRDDRCYLVTDEQAAERYKRAPEKAPEYLRPLVAKLDLTAAVPPDGISQRDKPMSINSNGRAAANERAPEAVVELPDPAAPEMSPAWNDLRQVAFTSLDFVRAAERLRRSLEGDDEDAIFIECGEYCRYASNLDALLKPEDWERHRDLTVRALRLGHTLDARWLILKRKSGLAEFDMMNLIDAPTTEYNPGDPFPFWVGHELTYRRFFENAVELLEALDQPMKDPGPIPFSDTPDPSDNDPAANGPQTNGQAPAPPAERPELVAAPPSGNETAATGGTPLAGSGGDFEALAAAPEDSIPKAPKSNLSVDDLAVATWTRLSQENGRPPSIARVAREIGHSRQHLYDCPTFMSLVRIGKEKRENRKRDFPRGVNRRFEGLEAYRDED